MGSFGCGLVHFLGGKRHACKAGRLFVAMCLQQETPGSPYIGVSKMFLIFPCSQIVQLYGTAPNLYLWATGRV